MNPYLDAMQVLFRGGELTPAMTRGLADAMMAGSVDRARVSTVLSALQMKGLTVDELVIFAERIGVRYVPMPVRRRPLIDVAGCGPRGATSAHLEVLVALVVAATGLTVAPQVRRARAGRCGGVELLEALGARVSLSPAQAGAVVDRVGVGFVAMAEAHPALAWLGAASLGSEVVFGVLGPLCHPALPELRVVGVADAVTAERVAGALARLARGDALVIAGPDGFDGLGLSGPSRTWRVVDGVISEGVVAPDELGFDPVPHAEVAGGDVAQTVAIARRVLGGDIDCPHGQVVALNAGLVLATVGQVDDLAAGVWAAEEVLRTGKASEMLRRYCEASLHAAA